MRIEGGKTQALDGPFAEAKEMGLHPSSLGWRIRYQSKQRSIVDGPFAESKEMIAGYTMISVRTREDALERFRALDAAQS